MNKLHKLREDETEKFPEAKFMSVVEIWKALSNLY